MRLSARDVFLTEQFREVGPLKVGLFGCSGLDPSTSAQRHFDDLPAVGVDALMGYPTEPLRHQYRQSMGQVSWSPPVVAHPCMMRAYRPVQLFGLIQDTGVTTLATHRSQPTSAGSVYHARWEKDSIIETWDSRYKVGGGEGKV